MKNFKQKLKLFIISIVKKFFPYNSGVKQIYNNMRLNLYNENWLKKFEKQKPKKYENYFYFLSPSPNEADLKKYYAEINEEKKDTKSLEIMKRELTQFSFLIRNFNFANKDILNFGSGKSGFSYLCKLLGSNVTEIDAKKKIETSFDKDIFFTNNIEDLKGKKYDLIYSSHSLEHITDIKKILKNFKMLSHENTSFFFEVPDGEIDLGYRTATKKFFPHLFYFKKNFYEKIFLNEEDKFFNIYDNENLKEYSHTASRDNIRVWTNQKLNLDMINKLNY